MEYVGPRYRTFVANMSIAIFFTMAACMLPWIAYYLANWRILAVVTSAPLLLAVFTPLVVPESARFVPIIVLTLYTFYHFNIFNILADGWFPRAKWTRLYLF